METKSNSKSLLSSIPNPTIRYMILALLSGFICWDWYSSFEFYRQTALLGDFAGITLPSDWYTPVLEDPFGINMLLTGEAHAAPNRFWAHFITHSYFSNVPLFLQGLGVSPIDSLYLACAFMKLITHVGLVLILSKWVLGNKSLWSSDTIVLSAFITSFFLVADTHHRAFDIRGTLNLIDASIAYTVFYATSLLLLMLYLHPFLQRVWGFKEMKFSVGQHLLLAFLAIVVSFNGPTSSPVILLICPLLLLGLWWRNWQLVPASSFIKKTFAAIQKLPTGILLQFIWIGLLNLYSFYLGTFNLENPVSQPPLSERYALLLQGFYHEYIYNQYHPSPLAIIFLFILLNSGLILKFVNKEQQRRYWNAFALIAVFFVIYTLLLPLGGYRAYRPLILRYDTIMPTTIAWLFLFFYSSYLLLQHLEGLKKMAYAILPVSLLIFLTIVDHIPTPPSNTCEYEALEKFAAAEEKLVLLPSCPVLSWHTFLSPTGSDSKPVSLLLYHWNVIEEEEKRFYMLE